jgi:hypothetical protein
MIPPLDRLTRRALLKCAGASLALPFLPSLSWADDPAAPAPLPPKRWATILFANGVYDPEWWSKGSGKDMELSTALKPLEPYRGHFTTIEGLHLFDENQLNVGPHTPFFTNFLCAKYIQKTVNNHIAMAESCDQVMARTLGMESFIPSLHLVGEEVRVGLEGGLPGIIDYTISWSSPTNPVPPYSSPRDAFDALFDVKNLATQKSILDGMLDDLRRMRGELSVDDRHKVAEFTDSVRELEHRIERASAPRTGWQPSLKQPDILRPAQDAAQMAQLSPGIRHKMMMRILALAFEMDKTRLATVILQGDGSFMGMGFVPGCNNGLHTLSHHLTDKEMTRQFVLTNQYHVSLLASLMGKLQSVDEGGSTLLDNSMILFGSNVGDNHNGEKVPLILAGGGGGTLKPGSTLRFEKPEDRRLCNLHLAMMQRMGVMVDGKPITQFSNSLKVLEGI